MTRNRPMTASERQRKNKQYVRKGKGKATPTELTSPISDFSPYTPGKGSGIASKEDDGGPVDKSVLTTFKDHIAYAIWHGELEGTRKLYTSSRWPKFKSWDLSKEQVAVDAALSLVEGALFGGQSQDMSAIVNKVYDILKVTRTGDYENSMGERRSKRLQDLSPTVSTPGRAKAPPRKKSKK
ncbi:hypothetical protein LguiA_032091 [Lonicera macranthoides]